MLLVVADSALVPVDTERAAKLMAPVGGWLNAQNVDPCCQWALGCACQYGLGTPTCPEVAVQLFTLASNQGLAAAHCSLAACYRDGTGVARDARRCVELFTLAAEKGHARGQYGAGFCYHFGHTGGMSAIVTDGAQVGPGKDLNKAAYYYTLAANQGLKEAQFSSGHCYTHGSGVAKDPVRGQQYFESAARQGHPGAAEAARMVQDSIAGAGVLLQLVDSTKRGDAVSAKKLQGYVGEGSAVAAACLALLLASGDSPLIPVDAARASELMKGAIVALRKQESDPHVRFIIGCASERGVGIPVDLPLAVKSYEFASGKGLPCATFSLGSCYANGVVVAKGMDKAAELFAAAAKQGNSDAQFQLGQWYASGIGVAKSKAMAKDSLRMAANQGHAGAGVKLKELESSWF